MEPTEKTKPVTALYETQKTEGIFRRRFPEAYIEYVRGMAGGKDRRFPVSYRKTDWVQRATI